MPISIPEGYTVGSSDAAPADGAVPIPDGYSIGAAASSSLDPGDLATKYATQYGIDPSLISAQMHQESGGKQSAVSPKGAIGLMQLMPDTASQLGVDPNNPEANVQGGVSYMASLLKQFNGNVPQALAAYNAGPAVVQDFRDGTNTSGKNQYNIVTPDGIPPFRETQNYVKTIMARSQAQGRTAQAVPIPDGFAVGKPTVEMVGPKGDRVDVPTDEVPEARKSQYAVLPQPGVRPMATPDGQLTFALPNEVQDFTSTGHVPLNNDGSVDQGYLYSKYGLDIKGKISTRQLNAARDYDVAHGNYVADDTPDLNTGQDQGPGENSYEPSDAALKSVGVDPAAYNKNQGVALHRTLTGNTLPAMDPNGNITGASGDFNPATIPRTMITTLLNAPKAIYHAAVDDPTQEEIEDHPGAHNGPGLFAKRLLVDPAVNELQKAKRVSEEDSNNFALGTVGKYANAAAHVVGGVTPLVGPMAANIGEGLVEGTGQQKAEALGNLGALVLGPDVMKGASDAVGSLGRAGLSTAADLAGRAVLPIVGTGVKVAGSLAKIGVKAGRAAAPYAGDFLGGMTDSITSAIGDKVSDLTEGSASDAMDAIKSVRDTAVQTLADKGITGEAAIQAANDLVSRVQEQARNWVSSASDQVGSAVSDWADRVKQAVPEAAGKLGDLVDGMKETITGQIDNLRGGSASDALDAMSQIRKSAIADLASRGIKGDAANAAVNSLMDTIHDSYKAWTQPVGGGAPLDSIRNTVTDWTKSLNDRFQVPDDATAISKAANTPAGAPLKAVATPGQMAGGLLATLERMARKTGEGIGDKIAAKYDAPARAAAEQSLNNAVDQISPETANMTQQERIDFLSKQLPQPPSAHAQALMDFNRRMNQKYAPTGVVATEATKPPALRANEADMALRNRLSGTPGEMDPGLAFSRMQDMSTEEFLRTLSKAKDSAPAVRQGYFRYLADSARDPETGAYRFGKMNDLVKDNYGKLGSDAPQFKTLSEGLAELQKSWDMTNTKSRTLLMTTLGVAAASMLEVVFAGANPIHQAGLVASEFLLYKYGAPLAVDLLMNPRNVSDLNLVMRAASRVPENTVAEKQIKQAAARLKNNFAAPLLQKVSESLQQHISPAKPE